MYNSVEEVKLADLPEEFVLKPNHLSGEVLMCKDKEHFDWPAARKRMKKWLKTNYYYQTGEWGYKDIQPRILCEKLLQENIIDYKFFCFNGRPTLVDVIGNRRKNKTYNDIFVDLNFDLIAVGANTGGGLEVQRPKNWEEMIHIAQILSKDFPFVRVDLYDEGQIFFGELTFSPANGMDAEMAEELDKRLGQLYDVDSFSEEIKRENKVGYWVQIK